ncbi:MAG: 30S ribosomal protein S17e [Euryarchaeota archaeon]|nr:30S ribosomal protein S17e [Euryarchaeota archaeon]
MGAVKPTYVKRLGKQLLRDVPDVSDDFDMNKKIVKENTNIKGKGVQNRIAGYITHKKRRESKR